MSADAFRRIVEAFFRRWPFYVLLLVGALVVGYTNVSRTVDEYTSDGSIFVDSQSLVTTQSGVQDGGFFSYLTPAQFTSQELVGLISTDVFMGSVLTRAGVDLADEPIFRSNQLDQFRLGISTYAESEALVAVTVTTDNPDLSTRVAVAIIDEFVQFQISIDIAESGASEEFFSDLVRGYQQDLVAAQREVDIALRGVSELDELSPERQLDVARLQEAEALAAQRFGTAVDNVEASRLATLQAETDIRQSYSVFDPPQVPVEPNGSLIDDVTVLAIFALVGTVLALAGPVVSALLNRTVLFPDDLQLDGDVEVIAVFPRIRKKALRLDRAPAPEVRDPELSGPATDFARQTITFAWDSETPKVLPNEGAFDLDADIRPRLQATGNAQPIEQAVRAPAEQAAAAPVSDPIPAAVADPVPATKVPAQEPVAGPLTDPVADPVQVPVQEPAAAAAPIEPVVAPAESVSPAAQTTDSSPNSLVQPTEVSPAETDEPKHDPAPTPSSEPTASAEPVEQTAGAEEPVASNRPVPAEEPAPADEPVQAEEAAEVEEPAQADEPAPVDDDSDVLGEALIGITDLNDLDSLFAEAQAGEDLLGATDIAPAEQSESQDDPQAEEEPTESDEAAAADASDGLEEEEPETSDLGFTVKDSDGTGSNGTVDVSDSEQLSDGLVIKAESGQPSA